MQPTSSVTTTATHARAPGAPRFVRTGPSGDPAQLLTRGPLAARAHRLLGLGAVGSARLGQGQRAMTAAFGGDVATYHRIANPWIGARSLARPIETLPTQSSVAWLLSTATRR